MNLKRKLLSIAASLALAAGILAVDLSSPQVAQASCSQAYVNVYEHTNYGGAGLALCYNTAIINLADYGWNDRISSAKFREMTVNVRACLYDQAGYILSIWTPNSNEDGNFWVGGDRASSFRFVNNGQNC